MKIAAALFGILAALSSLPLAASGHELVAARGDGTVFWLLPAASFLGAVLALELTALAGCLLLSLGFFWFMLGAEMHYGTTVFTIAVASSNGAAGLLAIAAWLCDGLSAAGPEKVIGHASAISRSKTGGLPRRATRRPLQQNTPAVFVERQRKIPEYLRDPNLQHAFADQEPWPNITEEDESKAGFVRPVIAAVQD